MPNKTNKNITTTNKLGELIEFRVQCTAWALSETAAATAVRREVKKDECAKQKKNILN